MSMTKTITMTIAMAMTIKMKMTNKKWLVRQVQEQETIDDPSEGYMLRQFWLA